MTFRPSQFRLELYFASKFEFGGKMRKFVRSPKEALLDALFEGYAGPAFEVRLWDGLRWFSLSGEKPVCTIVIESPQALTALVAEPNEITLGEAFIYGDLDVEGDIFSVFSIAEYLFNRPRPLRQQILEKASAARFGLAHAKRPSIDLLPLRSASCILRAMVGPNSCLFLRIFSLRWGLSRCRPGTETRRDLPKAAVAVTGAISGHWVWMGQPSDARRWQIPRACSGYYDQ
jgi:AcrR family transcriptional regulator